MRNSQDIVSIWSRAHSEIFKSALVDLWVFYLENKIIDQVYKHNRLLFVSFSFEHNFEHRKEAKNQSSNQTLIKFYVNKKTRIHVDH